MSTLADLFPGKTRIQIWGKAFAMGYRRPRCPPKSTGMPLVDDIRFRAFKIRITMTEVGAFVVRKRYFVGPRHMAIAGWHPGRALAGTVNKSAARFQAVDDRPLTTVWTAHEDERLRTLYPRYDLLRVALAFRAQAPRAASSHMDEFRDQTVA